MCWVDDLVRGVPAFADIDISGPVNLGNPNEMSVRRIAEDVRRMSGPKRREAPRAGLPEKPTGG